VREEKEGEEREGGGRGRDRGDTKEGDRGKGRENGWGNGGREFSKLKFYHFWVKRWSLKGYGRPRGNPLF
jgi:hypothetical protein